VTIIQQHADGIIRDAPPTREHKMYPKYMTHPAYQPGQVGTEVRSPGGFSYHVGGTPIRYPPVLVPDADSEEYHASQGYVSHGKSSPEDFARAVQAMPPPDENYRPQEYPKWVGDYLVNSREEEELAAHKRRVQLGIEEPVAETPVVESNPEPAPSPESTPPQAQPAPLDARMAALEQSVDEIKAMFVQFMAQREPQRSPEVAVASEPVAPVEVTLPGMEMSQAAPEPDRTRQNPTEPAKRRAKPAKPRKPQMRRTPRDDTQTSRAAKQVAAVMEGTT